MNNNGQRHSTRHRPLTSSRFTTVPQPSAKGLHSYAIEIEQKPRQYRSDKVPERSTDISYKIYTYQTHHCKERSRPRSGQWQKEFETFLTQTSEVTDVSRKRIPLHLFGFIAANSEIHRTRADQEWPLRTYMECCPNIEKMNFHWLQNSCVCRDTRETR